MWLNKKKSTEYVKTADDNTLPAVLPNHIGIIMDGNGRWATKKNMPRSFGHKAGVDTVRSIVRYSSDIGIKALSLYAFSTENWGREDTEVSTLMKILFNFFSSEVEVLHKENVKVIILGNLDRFAPEIRKVLIAAIDKTANNTGLILGLALNYGAQDEIVNACKHIACDVLNNNITIDDITKDMLNSNLYTSIMPELDLIIRPGGEKRISNFLLWQSAYAEFVFCDTLWPDFTNEEYLKALNEFSDRKRRFGK